MFLKLLHANLPAGRPCRKVYSLAGWYFVGGFCCFVWAILTYFSYLLPIYWVTCCMQQPLCLKKRQLNLIGFLSQLWPESFSLSQHPSWKRWIWDLPLIRRPGDKVSWWTKDRQVGHWEKGWVSSFFSQAVLEVVYALSCWVWVVSFAWDRSVGG